MVISRRVGKIVAQPVEVGPLYGGNTKPDLLGILTWDQGGGYVDLTGATVKCAIRRYDRVKKQVIGATITLGTCELISAVNGEALFVWVDALPLATVPVDPGYYGARWQVVFSDGGVQESQDAIFETIPSSDFL